jgi:hypothetical protein
MSVIGKFSAHCPNEGCTAFVHGPGRLLIMHRRVCDRVTQEDRSYRNKSGGWSGAVRRLRYIHVPLAKSDEPA